MTQNSIGDTVERLETIIETLDTGEVSLERAQELHEEGQALLEDLEEMLDVGEGSVNERS